MAKSKSSTPKLPSAPRPQPVVHLPLIKINSFFKEVYGYNQAEYWHELCEDHMFRGNDSSKNFYCQFLEEVVDKKALAKIPVSQEIKELVLLDDEKAMLNKILKTSPKTFLEEYEKIASRKKEILEALGKEQEYYFGYFIRGLFESAVVSQYKLKDYHKLGKYFFHISW